MKVLIVAKTRRGHGACVGGISREGQSVRLVAPNAKANDRAGLEYTINDLWEIQARPDPEIVPPHVENVIVSSARFLERIEDSQCFIRQSMPPVEGGPELLFDGLVQTAAFGPLYIAERSGLPKRSTMFWVSDQPLHLDIEGKRIRYRYRTPDGGRTLTF